MQIFPPVLFSYTGRTWQESLIITPVGWLTTGVASPQMQFDSQHDHKNVDLQPAATSNREY